MGMTSKTRAGLIAGIATGALAIAALAGTTVANAADSTPTPSQSAPASQGRQDMQRAPEEVLTGDAAAKVKAAVEAKYPDATIDRMEKDADGESVYEAHITKADGSHVTVLLDASYAITGESAHGPGGKGGRGPGRAPEEVLTGDAAAKVKAAVEAKYPDATIDRMEKDADGESVYEAHITKADGSHVTVLLDASYAITGESAHGPGGKGHGGRGGHRHGGPDGTGQTGGAASSAAPSGSSAPA